MMGLWILCNVEVWEGAANKCCGADSINVAGLQQFGARRLLDGHTAF